MFVQMDGEYNCTVSMQGSITYYIVALSPGLPSPPQLSESQGRRLGIYMIVRSYWILATEGICMQGRPDHVVMCMLCHKIVSHTH